jgi:hypothetical protein
MAFIDKSAGGSSQPTLPQLSRDRIEASLVRRDWRFAVDSDGDVTGSWDHNQFYFFIGGRSKEILHIQGCWRQNLTVDQRGAVLLAMNEWHQEKLFPKCYLRVDDSGALWVYTDHIVDWEHGLTDDQLDLTITCALMTSLQFFEFMAERFPVSFPPTEP